MNLISSDRPMGGDALKVLPALLDTLLPASADGRLPSAASFDFLAHLERFDAAYIGNLAEVLQSFDSTFATLPLDERVVAVRGFQTSDPVLFQQLILRVYDCYYQQDAVRHAIGVTAGSPFPEGNKVTDGDLSLLDPVIRHAEQHRYRPA